MIRAATGRIEEREGEISYQSQEKLCLMTSQESYYSYTRRALLGWEAFKTKTKKYDFFICLSVIFLKRAEEFLRFLKGLRMGLTRGPKERA